MPNPHLCTFRIANTGRVPITASNFERPLEVTFMRCGHPDHQAPKVLTHEVVEHKPEALNPYVGLREGKLLIAPLLLNRGDSMTIRVLTDQCFDRQVRVSGRIEGVERIEVPKIEKPNPKWILVGLLLMGVSVSLVSLKPLSGSDTFACVHTCRSVLHNQICKQKGDLRPENR